MSFESDHRPSLVTSGLRYQFTCEPAAPSGSIDDDGRSIRGFAPVLFDRQAACGLLLNRHIGGVRLFPDICAGVGGAPQQALVHLRTTQTQSHRVCFEPGTWDANVLAATRIENGGGQLRWFGDRHGIGDSQSLKVKRAFR